MRRLLVWFVLRGFLPPVPAKFKGRVAVCVAAVVLFILFAVFGERGLVQLSHVQKEQRQLEEVAFDLQQRNDDLRRRIERLTSDDRYIERLARERLGLVKKGELVYRLPETDSRK